MIKKFLFLSLFALLAACSGDQDNTEPPAELVDFDASAKIIKLWHTSTGSGVQQQYLKLFPLLLDDRLVVADRSGVVTAISLNDGQKLWTTDLDVVLSGGVGGDQSNYFVTSRAGELISLARDGKVNWRKDIASEVLTPPVLTDHHIIVRGVDGAISALTTDSGTQVWTFKRDVPALSLRGTSQPVISFGRIYSGLDNGRLVVLDATDGRALLDVAVAVPTGRTELERIVDIDGQAVIRDGVLYMGSYQGRVVAIDVRRGQLSWSRKMSIVSGVELSGSYLFTSDERDHIWALDRNNGATIWKQEKLKARQITLPVAMSDALVVADNQGYIHWLSQYDGHFIARTLVDDSGIIVPPVVKGDRVYVQDRDGTVSAFQLILDN